MNHLQRVILLLFLATMLLIAGWPDVASVATMPGAKSDPVYYADTDTIDVPILRQNGVLVGTAAGNPIFSPLANQALAAGTVIQHSNSMTFIELVRISSNGGPVTSSATPRIEAGVDGQIIILQGTSATNTYTIPTGSGVLWGASSIFFDNLTSRVLTYNGSINAWVEGVTTTSGGGGITEWSADITPAQITATQNNYAPTGLSTATVLRLSSDASRDITGLTGGTDGRILILRNVGTQNLVLRSENTSSTAANRFAFTADITMLPNALVLLQYDVTSLRWGAIFSSAAAAGGGSDVEKVPVAAATTGNVNVGAGGPGVNVFDGFTLVNGQRLLVRQQTVATENGIYQFNGSGSSMARTTDADADAEFANNFTVKVQGGTLYGGVTFMLQNTGVVTLNSTNITFAVESWGTKAEVLANKNVNSGYMGLNTLGKSPWNRTQTPAIHPDLSPTSQINVPVLLSSQGANVIAIQNSGAGNVILTTGDPRIVGCTSGNDAARILLVGLSTSKTVTIPNGQGVLLAGATGSATVGIPPGGSPTEFRCNGATTTWEQIGGGGQTFPINPNVTIYACGDARNPVFDGGGGNKWEFCLDPSTSSPVTKAFCGGVQCPSTTMHNLILGTFGSKPTCTSAVRFMLWPTSGGAGTTDTEEVCDKNSSDVYAWRGLGSGGGSRTTTLPMQLMSIDVSNANAFLDTIDGANFDYSGVRFLDGATGTAFYKLKIPLNVSGAPAWNIVMTAKAISGAGGNAVLSISAKDYATNVALDSALTALQTSTAYAMSTSANTTIFTTTGTNYDSAEALSPGNFLIVSITRSGGSGSDTINADLLILDVSLRIDVN